MQALSPGVIYRRNPGEEREIMTSQRNITTAKVERANIRAQLLVSAVDMDATHDDIAAIFGMDRRYVSNDIWKARQRVAALDQDKKLRDLAPYQNQVP
jgi:hypothetical protein